MAAGKIALQANDTRIYEITAEDGASGNVALTLPKEGGTLATDVYMSLPASRLLAGDITVTNEIVTQGMNTTLYTGNGSTQSVVTGIDMTTQWGNSASEMFGGLVWIKNRTAAQNHAVIDTVRGSDKIVTSSGTLAEFTNADLVTTFGSTGFSVGTNSWVNGSTNALASWNFQTTHRTSGVTNHGKAYTCHYNPFTGFTIVKYEGSGTAGHEIPHHLGRKLNLKYTKNLSVVEGWSTTSDLFKDSYLRLNETTALSAYASIYEDTDTAIFVRGVNTNTNQYILYGWANSYYDDEGVLKGNYEIGTYVGTGVAGNKVTTRGKPAWVMVKALSATGSWLIKDNQRNGGDNSLYANLSDAEYTSTGEYITLNADGVTIDSISPALNGAGVTYLYMVAYDTNANGGGTYYPRTQDTSMLQVTDAQLMYSDGYANGTAKNSSEVLSGVTYPAITYSAGYNYVKKAKDGSFSAKPYEPKFGEYGTRSKANETPDIYIDGKWYSSASAPELVTNGTFDTNTTGWTVGTAGTVTVVNGAMRITENGTDYPTMTYTLSGLVVGKKYRLKATLNSSDGGATTATLTVIGAGAQPDGGAVFGNGTFVDDFIPTSTSHVLQAMCQTTTLNVWASFDDISVFEADIVPSTPLGNITYLPIKVLADAGGQIVSSESWKYPEIVSDGIVTRSLKVTGEFDLGQTWQDVTSKRAVGTTYTNSTGKPIVVIISTNTGLTTTYSINGLSFITGIPSGGSPAVTIIVPNNNTYSTSQTFLKWLELR